MEKKIEEMSKEIANILIDAAHKACEDIPFAPLDLDSRCPVNIECHRCKEARMLIAKDYRKQAEVIDEFAQKLKEAPIKCGIPLLGLSTKEEIEEYFNGIMFQVRDAIDSIAKEMKGE